MILHSKRRLADFCEIHQKVANLLNWIFRFLFASSWISINLFLTIQLMTSAQAGTSVTENVDTLVNYIVEFRSKMINLAI